MAMSSYEIAKRNTQHRRTLAEKSDKNWCSAMWNHLHRFSDWGTWVDHRHPQCDYCGFVDESRDLPPIKGHPRVT